MSSATLRCNKHKKQNSEQQWKRALSCENECVLCLLSGASPLFASIPLLSLEKLLSVEGGVRLVCYKP